VRCAGYNTNTVDPAKWIRADSKTVATTGGERELWFAVIGDPCLESEAAGPLDLAFTSPFDAGHTPSRSARRPSGAPRTGSWPARP
jgi:hypothetical protein